MYFKHFGFLLLSTIIYCINADSSEETNLDQVKTLIKIGYEANKLLAIQDIIDKALGGNTDNITIVGTQDVRNKDGTFKEIRAVALHLPTTKKHPSKMEEIENDDESDDSAVENYSELKKIVKLLKNIGLPLEAMYKEFDKDGEVTEAGYVNADNEFILYDGVGYLNKTIKVTDEKPIEEKLKSLQDTALPVAVLKYDSEGNYLENESRPAAELYAGVEEQENTDPKTLKKILDLVGKVGVKNFHTPKNIPKELVAELDKEFPKYTFLVTSNSDGEYVSKDFVVRAGFYLIDTDAESLSFNIYGLLKENNN